MKKNKKLIFTLLVCLAALGGIIYKNFTSDSPGVEVIIYNETSKDMVNIEINYNLSEGPIPVEKIEKRNNKSININPKEEFTESILKMKIPEYKDGEEFILIKDYKKKDKGKLQVYIREDKNSNIKVDVKEKFLK
ncbi:hypothetical protein [Clostridium hydrogeniformans]|uniref:hypothetical protein n=1 Tax=Clostridium hydrogeniformans TaxID=349933 RepID=UPI0004859736|nr:hypothetical protein [Clostridium hydrogeniformans]